MPLAVVFDRSNRRATDTPTVFFHLSAFITGKVWKLPFLNVICVSVTPGNARIPCLSRSFWDRQQAVLQLDKVTGAFVRRRGKNLFWDEGPKAVALSRPSISGFSQALDYRNYFLTHRRVWTPHIFTTGGKLAFPLPIMTSFDWHRFRINVYYHSHFGM